MLSQMKVRLWAMASLGMMLGIASAQTSTTGSINGTVVDSTGALVPDVSVTVKDLANGSLLNLKSNAEGRFTAPFLKPDNFAITAVAKGLQSTTTEEQVMT